MYPAFGRWLRDVTLLTIAATSMVPGASAQTGPPAPASSPGGIQAIVPAGEVVAVTDTAGRTTKGKFRSAADDAVSIQVRDGILTVPAASLRRVSWQQRDSPLTGVLIGAAIGAVPGVYWLIADPNECTGMCPEEYAFIAIGAAAGGLVDHFVKKMVTVYTTPTSAGRSRSVAVAPLLAPNRKGVRVALRF